MIVRNLLAFLMLLLLSSPAFAADVTVEIDGVRNANGDVLVAICNEAKFLGADCPRKKVKAAPGHLTVVVANVPPGTYAVQAFHDENANGVLDSNFIGIPEEGVGLSRDAIGHFGPPKWADAKIDIGDTPLTVPIKLEY